MGMILFGFKIMVKMNMIKEFNLQYSIEQI